MITRVYSRIFTNSPYAWFLQIFMKIAIIGMAIFAEKWRKSYIGWIRKNPGIHQGKFQKPGTGPRPRTISKPGTEPGPRKISDHQNFENLGPIRTGRSPDQVVRGSLLVTSFWWFYLKNCRFKTKILKFLGIKPNFIVSVTLTIFSKSFLYFFSLTEWNRDRVWRSTENYSSMLFEKNDS